MTAQAALLVWPVVAILLYRKLSLPWALAWTIVGGYLLLPTQTGWNFPLLPTLNKNNIPALTALVLTAVALSGRKRTPTDPYLAGWIPRDRVVLVLLVLFVFSGFGTILTNTDPVQYGGRRLPGLTLYDMMSSVQGSLMVVIPFLLARRVFATSEGHRVLLTVIAIAGAFYAVPALYEIRMSPQLSNMIYGFFPHSFAQHARGGGWRPVVFLNHGLWLAIFFCVAALSAFGLWRAGLPADKRKMLGLGVVILVTLALSKSLTGLAIALLMLPIVLLASKRLQLLLAAGVAAAVLTYPTIRYSDLVPTGKLLSVAESISAERANSLATRFRNEDLLLARAKERSIFGWGGWGRSRVYDQEGTDISITDGGWVISFGVGGWVGYVGQFGLLGFSIIALALRRRRYDPDPVTAVLALVLAANFIDLIPNSGLSPVTWLMAGALAGRLELARAAGGAETEIPQPVADESRRPVIAYRRGEERSTATARGQTDRRDRKSTPFTRFPPKPKAGT